MAQRSVGFGPESTYGTPVVPGTNEFPQGIESFDFQQEQTFEDVLAVDEHSTRKPNLLTKKWNGSLEFLGIFQEPLGLLLKHLIGSNDVSGVGPYTHTFPASTGIPAAGRIGKSLTVETKEDAALESSWAGGKVTELRLTSDPSKSVRIGVTMKGTVEDNTITAAAATHGAYDVMLMSDTTVSFDALALDVDALDLSIKWDTDDPFGLGSPIYVTEPNDIGGLQVSGSLNLFFKDNVQYDKFKNQTEIDIQIVITNGTESLTINLNKATIRSFSKAVQGQDRLKATVAFVSHRDTAATENIQLVLVNDDPVLP